MGTARGPLADRSVRLLIGAQLLTVFNDNAFKQTVLLLAVAAQTEGDLQAWAGFVFALPFLILALPAGDLADRYSKRDIVLVAKLLEVGVMLFAALALYLGDLRLGIGALFLAGAQSALLGPAKYGILPELVDDADLARTNGLLQTTVFLAIIFGTASAGWFKTALAPGGGHGQLWLVGILFALLAAIGALLARGIRPVAPADPERRLRFDLLGKLRREVGHARSIPALLPAMLGHSLFWLVGAVLLYSWNEIGVRELEVAEGPWSTALAALSLSMAISCILAGRLCKDRVRVWLVPFGAVAMSISFLVGAFGPPDPLFLATTLFLGNLCAGLYLIPLRTLIQQLPGRLDRGRTLGASQLLDWIFILGASGMKGGLTAIGAQPRQALLLLSGLMLAAAVVLRRRLSVGSSAIGR